MARFTRLFGNSRHSMHDASKNSKAEANKKKVDSKKEEASKNVENLNNKVNSKNKTKERVQPVADKQVGKFNYKKLGIIGGCVIGTLLVGVMVLGGIVSSGNTVYPNVTFKGYEIGGMTYNEVCAKLEEAGYVNENNIVTVEFYGGEKVIDTLKVSSNDAKLTMSIDDAATTAVEYGHKGLFNSAFKYLGCLFDAKEISNINMVMDEVAVRAMIANAANNINSPYIENSFEIKEHELVVTKGSGDRNVDSDAVYSMIHDAFINNDYAPIKYNTSEYEPEEIDFQAISQQIYVEPTNAWYDEKTEEASEGVTGISLDVEAAQKAYDEAKVGSTFTIPFTLTEPEITVEQLETVLFKDVIASKTTSLTSSSNRNTNITLAAKAINGTVLNPGETFSFNDTVGQRTAAKGYKSAGAYVGGQTVNEIGGGICQVSSTIYYCVLASNLEVVERSNHRFPVTYLPMGLDATVNWGTIDFKFANNTDYPIKIVSYVESRELHIQLIGTKTSDNTFMPAYKYIGVKNYGTIEKPSAKVKSPTVETTGITGYTVDTYVYEYDADGNLCKTIYIDRSTYSTRDKVVLVPIKQADSDEEGNTGGGNTGGGNTGGGNTGGGNTGGGNTGGGETGGGETGGGETGGGETGGGETGGGETGGGETGGGETGGGETGGGETGGGETGGGETGGGETGGDTTTDTPSGSDAA